MNGGATNAAAVNTQLQADAATFGLTVSKWPRRMLASYEKLK